MAAEWVKIENSFFSQNPKNQIDKGWMSLDDAKQKVLANPGVALGFTVQKGSDDSNCYCEVVKLGTSKYEDGGESHDCYVYKVSLPDEDLFEDDFSEDNWKRPGRGEGLADEVQELCLFSGVDPADLHQGGLGDCWLISAMAALSEFPEQTMGLFSQKEIAMDGNYTITLYSYENDLAPYPINIDDRFPVRRSGFKNVRATDEGEIWPCLLEKAFAAYAGGYEELDGGQSVFAFGAMTGCRDIVWYKKDDGDTWNTRACEYTSNKPHDWQGACCGEDIADADMLSQLQEFDNQNFLMCCASASGSDSDTNDMGVVQGHAYSLITVKTNVAGSGYDLLCLRNPWGQKEWQGDWSDDSELWDENPEVAQECGHVEEDDGLFWISWEDFCENYKSIYVCKKGMGASRGKSEIAQNSRAIADGSIDDRPQKMKASLGKKRAEQQACAACGGCPMM